MLRESRIEGVPEHISEVASAIAEEGLRYVSDSSPGYRRKRTGTSFTYYDGKRITDKAVIRRIKSIGIPPAYEFIWICPSAKGGDPSSRSSQASAAVGSNREVLGLSWRLASLRPDGLGARALQGGGDPFGVVSMTIHRNFKQAVQLLMRLRRRRGLGIGARGTRPGRVRAAHRLDDNVASRHAAILDNALDRSSASRRVSNSPMIVLSKAGLRARGGSQLSYNARSSNGLARH
jgi:hypothetical protein